MQQKKGSGENLKALLTSCLKTDIDHKKLKIQIKKLKDFPRNQQ